MKTYKGLTAIQNRANKIIKLKNETDWDNQKTYTAEFIEYQKAPYMVLVDEKGNIVTDECEIINLINFGKELIRDINKD